jgi:hypothetical protein
MGGSSAMGGGISNTDGWSDEPSLAVALDVPVVSWSEGLEIYVRRWNGSAWVEMGTESASGGGISNNGAWSSSPTLAILPNGARMVAWEDDSDGDYEIYIRRYPFNCYPLTLNHTGQGADPSANPDGYPGCPPRSFPVDQPITLTAVPASGWRVKTWSGTDNDNNQATSNTMTMPAASHTVRVDYEVIPPPTNWIYDPLVLYVLPPCYSAPNEQEPNNAIATANGPLCRGTITGLANDLIDYYWLETATPGLTSADVTNLHGQGMQLALFYQGTPVAFDTEQDDGLHVELPNAQPGRYYIRVYTETPNPAELRPYSLSVSFP